MIIWKLPMRTREKIGVGIALTFGVLSVFNSDDVGVPANDTPVLLLPLQLNVIQCSA